MSSDFPFLWGAATSSHQVEGDNRANDWWEWEEQGRVQEKSGKACDQYRLFRQDIELIASLGHNAHRFSLEWSRLEPEENQWQDEAFHHYEDFLKELRSRHIEPVVTLHHFTNPRWFMARGGWTRPENVGYFLRYVERVARAFGKYVRFWMPINEPMIYLYHSYYAGIWPPGKKSLKDSLDVFRRFLEAHIGAYRILHQYYQEELRQSVWVSSPQFTVSFSPCRKNSVLDRVIVGLMNWFMHDLFIQALLTGYLFFPGVFCERLSAKKSLDFVSMHYYSHDFLRFTGFSGQQFLGTICDKAHHTREIKEFNSMGWEIYPRGLYDLLKRMSRFKLPILISENGIATPDDEQRARFIRDHLAAVAQAKQEGVPVLGYFYWSLLDNFEWAHGFGPRFGIVEVDYQTQERKIRPSAYVLSESCRKLSHRT